MTLAVTADARLKSWLRVSVWVLESGLLCVATQPPRVRALGDPQRKFTVLLESVVSKCYLQVLFESLLSSLLVNARKNMHPPLLFMG